MLNKVWHLAKCCWNMLISVDFLMIFVGVPYSIGAPRNFQTTHQTRVSSVQSGRLCKHHLRCFWWQYCFNRLVRSCPSGKDGLQRCSHIMFCYGATSQIFATGTFEISSSSAAYVLNGSPLMPSMVVEWYAKFDSLAPLQPMEWFVIVTKITITNPSIAWEDC